MIEISKTVIETDLDGNKRWLLNGLLHRLDGPAVEYADGTKYWYVNGKLHRLDGPAVECADGDKFWWIDDKRLTEAKFNEKVKNQPTLTTDSTGNKRWKLNGELHRLDGPAVEYADGTKYWYVNGKLHRLDGPACEFANGYKEWYVEGEYLTEAKFNEKVKIMQNQSKLETDKEGNKYWIVNGQLHREDGPAIEYANGDKFWYVNGKFHRLDGPAIEWADGYKSWYVNGKRHRLDGPAVEYANGDKEWYVDDKKLTEQEVNEKLKLQPTLTIGKSGTKCWKLNGKLHRTDGPAIEYANGDDGYKAWYINNKRHRTNGPAIEYANGSKSWYVNGKCHRLDGPAIELVNGYKVWYIDGKQLTEQDFMRVTNKNRITINLSNWMLVNLIVLGIVAFAKPDLIELNNFYVNVWASTTISLLISKLLKRGD